MQKGKFNIILDAMHGSSGKGKLSTYLADKHNITNVSSSNYPNAGHSASWSDGTKFVAKAIPTSAILKKVNGVGIDCFISPGSGFSWLRLIQEWDESGRPAIYIHARSSVVTKIHKDRENKGGDSTKHVASTMQGTATAISDKILRKQGVRLAGVDSCGHTYTLEDVLEFESVADTELRDFLNSDKFTGSLELYDKIQIVDPGHFRNMTWNIIKQGHAWLHEGSQGYALSIDHGSHYPFCTSRNCTTQAAMDQMAVPPNLVGDVYLNLRSFPIRVGNVVEDGQQKGYSGDFYSDAEEITWDQVGEMAGMPEDERLALSQRELTTVTKRLRRVFTFSFEALVDAVNANGATHLCMNFIQYVNWADAGIKGGRAAFNTLSQKSRDFITKVEEVSGVPVVLIGTGANHDEMIDRSKP